MKTLEIKHRHDETVAGRIAVVIGLDVDTHRRRPVVVVGCHRLERLADEIGTDILMGEPLSQPMDDRFLQAFLVEDGRIEERRQQRIAVDRLHRFVADRAPDRVDRLHHGRAGNRNAVHQWSPA
jgi:hypothetical protein